MAQVQAQPQGYISFADMFDGGGMGRSGDTFEGGLFSDMLNGMGIRPYGYNARHAAPVVQTPDANTVRPQMRPQQATVSTRGGTSYAPAGGSGVQTSAPQVAAAVANAVRPVPRNVQQAEDLMAEPAGLLQAPPMSGPAGAPSQTAGMKRMSPGLAAMMQAPTMDETQAFLASAPANPNAMSGPAGMGGPPQTMQGLIDYAPAPSFDGFGDAKAMTSEQLRQLPRDQRLALIMSGVDWSPAQWDALGGM